MRRPHKNLINVPRASRPQRRTRAKVPVSSRRIALFALARRRRSTSCGIRALGLCNPPVKVSSLEVNNGRSWVEVRSARKQRKRKTRLGGAKQKRTGERASGRRKRPKRSLPLFPPRAKRASRGRKRVVRVADTRARWLKTKITCVVLQFRPHPVVRAQVVYPHLLQPRLRLRASVVRHRVADRRQSCHRQQI